MSVANRVIKNTGFLYAKMGITMFISLYVTRLILNALGAEDYGIFNVIGGAIAMLGFLNTAMTDATQRFMSHSEGEGNFIKQKKIFNISIIIHFSIAVLIGICLLGAGYFFFNGLLTLPPERVVAAKMIYYFMIASTMITVMTVPYDAVLNAHENMLYFSVVGVLESLLKLLAAYIVVHTFADKLILYGALMAMISVIVMITMRAYCHKHYKECVYSPKTHWDKDLFYSMASFAGWKFLTVSTAMISQYGLTIVLNNFWGAILNAAQAIANQISGQLMAFSSTMMKALNPVIVKSEGSGQRSVMLTASMLGAKFSFLLLAFFAVPFIIEAPYILKIWLHNIPEWAILFCRLQLVRSLAQQLTEVFGRTIDAQGEVKKYSITKSVLYIQPILLTSLLFSLGFPPYYLYITWIVCWDILGGIVTLYFAHKQCSLSIPIYFKQVLTPCLTLIAIMTITGFSVHIFLGEGFLRLVLVGLITSSSFVSIFYFAILSSGEKKVLSGITLIAKQKIKKFSNKKAIAR